MFIGFSRQIALLAVLPFLSACMAFDPQDGPPWRGPGHRAFMDQLSWQKDTPILSIQGYIIRSDVAAERLRDTWEEMAELMKRKPGFIQADLNPGARDSRLWIEISKWESAADLRAAFDDPVVQETAKKLRRIRFNHIFAASTGGHAEPLVHSDR